MTTRSTPPRPPPASARPFSNAMMAAATAIADWRGSVIKERPSLGDAQHDASLFAWDRPRWRGGPLSDQDASSLLPPATALEVSIGIAERRILAHRVECRDVGRVGAGTVAIRAVVRQERGPGHGGIDEIGHAVIGAARPDRRPIVDAVVDVPGQRVSLVAVRPCP